MKNIWVQLILILLGSLVGATIASARTQPAVYSADSAKHTILTLYSNAGLVRQQFVLSLRQGDNGIRIERMPDMAVPSSLLVRCDEKIALPKGYALEMPVTAVDVVQQYLGRTITIRQRMGIVEGELIVPPTTVIAGMEPCYSGAVIRLRNGELLVSPCGELLLPAGNTPLALSPTLTATFSANRSAQLPVELVYQCDGLQWQATYDAIIQNERSLQLTGFVRALNSTHTTFRCDTLHLVAGTMYLEQRYPAKRTVLDVASLQSAEALSVAPSLEALDEYYLYTVPFRTTLAPNATTTVLLRPTTTLQYTRRYRVRGRYYAAYQSREEGTIDVPVSTVVEFTNTPPDSQPLPAGIVRVWQRDGRGTLQLIGQDNIAHTPIGESVSLTTGNVFDIRASRHEVDYKRLAERIAEYTVEYTLRNRKSHAVQVSVVETFAGDWEIIASTIPAMKRSSRNAEFIATVPAKGSTTFRYTVRHSW